MNKIEFNIEQINHIIELYTLKKISTRDIAKIYNIDSGVIRRMLKENNIILRNSGQQFRGGKSESDKKYYNKNKESISKYFSKWREQNKEHLKEYMRKYREENYEKIKQTKRNYEKTRKNNDPIYKLIGNFRTAIYTVLKENDLSKFGHYFEILGYTPEDLINRLENQFKDGICWENYGKWHVDHIKPISSFNFTSIDDDEFKKCWSLDNLQPMWGKENILKSNKY